MEIFMSLTKDPCVPGLALLMGGTPHYDVLAMDITPLAEALAKSFGLGPKYVGDAEALDRLVKQEASRFVTPLSQIQAICPGVNLKEQEDILKVR